MADWKSTTYTLEYPLPPVEAGGEPIKTLTFREPDLETLELFDDLSVKVDPATGEPTSPLKFADVRKIFAALSATPVGPIGKMNPVDFVKISEEILPPLLASLAAMKRPASSAMKTSAGMVAPPSGK